jgi:hypothetical protein
VHATLRIPLLHHNYNTKTYKRKNSKEPVKQALEAPQLQQKNIYKYPPNLRNIKRILRGSYLHFIPSAASFKQLDVTHTHTHICTHARMRAYILLQNMLLRFVVIGSVLIITKIERDF